MKYKMILLLIVLVSMAGLGCTETDNVAEVENDSEEVEIAASENISQNNSSQIQNSTDQVTPTPPGEPNLEIVAVTSENRLVNIEVRNSGNATAHNVYCGLIAFGYSNSLAYEKYMTLDDYHVMADAIRGGVTDKTFTYDTGYTYGESDNLTIEYKMAGIDYIGDIPPGEAITGTASVVYGTYKSEYLKVAWIEGEEEEFAIY